MALCLGLPLALTRCASDFAPNPPPLESFYFPTGVVHVDDTEGGAGWLFVASANFDRRYDFGSIHAVDLNRVGDDATGGLPALGEQVESPKKIVQLNLRPEQQAFIAPFTGTMGRYALEGGGSRLFVASRAEDHRLHIVDAAPDGTLSCFGGAADSRECVGSAPSMVAFQDSLPNGEANPSGLPRAPAPISVAVSPEGQVMVTHLEIADSPPDAPPGSNATLHSYVVSLNAGAPALSPESFIEVGTNPTYGIAIGSRYAFVTGSIFNARGSLVRLIDRHNRTVRDPALETVFQVSEARGIALWERGDETRLYIAGRVNSDRTTAVYSLVIIDVSGASGDSPSLRVTRALPMPDGGAELAVITRPGRGPLVVATCSAAGVVVIYDDDVGQWVAQLDEVGEQPFGLAVDEQNGGARVYVAAFDDGRVAVIDIPTLARPFEARVVANLGASQACVVRPDSARCAEERR